MVEREQGPELRAIADWRARLLERVLLLCVGLLSIAMLLTFREPFIFERKLFAVAILPSWLLVCGAALSPRGWLRFRQVALVLGLLTVAVGSVAKLGFQAANGFCIHLMLVVMVALFMGKRAGWVVWMLGLLSWTTIAAFSVRGGAAPSTSLFDASLVSNWLRVISVYALISGITMIVVSYLAERMEAALTRSEALYGALTQESQQRIAALEEQRGLEQQLRQSQKLEALGTLAGGVAHDFNNLLTVIINQADLASAQLGSEPAQDALAQILLAGERAASLTGQLLAFGRRQVAQRSLVDVHARAEDSLRMLRRLLPSSIELKYEAEAHGPSVWAGEVELDQIVMNLCVNARDAMPSGGELTVRTSHQLRPPPGQTEPQKLVCISVQDTGTGMDEATRQRIFEPFFTTKMKGQGTGLGLSTVHGLVQQAGGFVEVDSTPGHGTTIRIYLPQYEGATPPRASASQVKPRRGSETILVADDDADVLEILTRMLSTNGYRVLACRDGEQALREYRQRSREIDLVISDAVMPKLGGRELHRAISEEFGEVPFLVCSGYAAQTLEPEFFDHPLRSFLAKPFNDQALQSHVRALLDVAQGAPVRPAVSVAVHGCS
jgi:signal transduction histidine kinase/ActR/RegA family two-component response regulator